MKTHRPELYIFTVEGVGDFPVDMLRYDACWPYMERDSALMQPSYRERRRVVLQSRSVSGPTEGRWSSFLWRVIGHGELRS